MPKDFDYRYSNKEKIEFICLKHGSFYKTYDNINKSVYGCNKCAKEKSKKTISKIKKKPKRKGNLSIDKLEIEIKNKFGNKIKLINNEDKIEIKNLKEVMWFDCSEHGLFKKTVENLFKSKHGCNKCGYTSSNKDRVVKYSINEIQDILNLKFNKNILITKNNSKNNIKLDDVLEFECKNHGIFKKTLKNIIVQKYGCNKCYKKSKYSNKKKTINKNKKKFKYDKNNIIKILNDKFNKNIILIENQNINNIKGKTILKFYCKKHGEFNNKVKNVLNSKYGCVQCSIEGRKNTNLKKYGHTCNLYKESVQEDIRQKHLKRYGVDNPLKSKEIQNKIKQTNIKKYGVENPAQSDIVKQKMKQTNLKKYGKEYYSQTNEYIEKMIKFYNKKYGYDWNFQSPEVIKQIKETNKEKYGYEYPIQSPIIKDKIKNTNLKRYGVEYVFQSPEIRYKILKTNLKKYGVENPFASKEIQEKIKKTNLKKYGSKNPNHNKEVRKKIEKTNIIKYGFKNPAQNEIIMNKIINTKRKNNTFNTSKPQEKMKKELLNLYPDLKTEYNKDERYPFFCDFYIPCRDLFIELNGFWTHGNHWFNEKDKKDLKKLEKWKVKNKKSYNNAIKIWTISDPLKRKTAINNNLNYIVFWNNDLKDFYKRIADGMPLS